MYMIKTFSDYVWGGDPERQTGLQEAEPELQLSTDDVEDEWTLVTEKENCPAPTANSTEHDTSTCNDDNNGDDGAAFSVVTEFGSNWIVAPPACFSGGVSPGDSVTLITSRENLLLEHPSLSFYTSHRFGARSTSAAAPRLEVVADAVEESGRFCVSTTLADATPSPAGTDDPLEYSSVSLSDEEGRPTSTRKEEKQERLCERQLELAASSVPQRQHFESNERARRELTSLLSGNEHEVDLRYAVSCGRAFGSLRAEQQVETSFRRQTIVPGRRAMARMNNRQRNGFKNKAASVRWSGAPRPRAARHV